MRKRVTIFGAGYVGLPMAARWSQVNPVVVYDPITEKILQVRRAVEGGDLYIHEKGLKEGLQQNKERLTFSDSIQESLKDAEFIFICVGTPPKPNGKADLQYIQQAARDIGKHIDHKAIIITKSTVPPGTGYLIEKIVKEELAKRGATFSLPVASCPEFLAEGTAMQDLHSPSRIVIGCDDKEALQEISDFFCTFHSSEKIVAMDLRSAEATKYFSNAIMASRISFMNSAAMFCDAIGANIHAVRKALGKDPRIGGSCLYAGFGYGGSCFPKDTRAIEAYGEMVSAPLKVVESTIQVNEDVLRYFFTKIHDHYTSLQGKTFLVWGIGFKAGTDDVRDSQATKLCDLLLQEGANIIVHDVVPSALQNFQATRPTVKITTNPYEFITEVDGLLIGNENEAFRLPDIDKLASMKEKVIFDGKNVLSDSVRKELEENGFVYRGVGTDDVDKEKLVQLLQQYLND